MLSSRAPLCPSPESSDSLAKKLFWGLVCHNSIDIDQVGGQRHIGLLSLENVLLAFCHYINIKPNHAQLFTHNKFCGKQEDNSHRNERQKSFPAAHKNVKDHPLIPQRVASCTCSCSCNLLFDFFSMAMQNFSSEMIAVQAEEVATTLESTTKW